MEYTDQPLQTGGSKTSCSHQLSLVFVRQLNGQMHNVSKSVLLNSTIRLGVPFQKKKKKIEMDLVLWVLQKSRTMQNIAKNLDPFYQMDLDFKDCFGRGKNEEIWY